MVWHSHALYEVANYDAGFGGMLTLERIDPLRRPAVRRPVHPVGDDDENAHPTPGPHAARSRRLRRRPRLARRPASAALGAAPPPRCVSRARPAPAAHVAAGGTGARGAGVAAHAACTLLAGVPATCTPRPGTLTLPDATSVPDLGLRVPSGSTAALGRACPGRR